MKTLVKYKEQRIKCACCGAEYRLERPKDYKKIKYRKRDLGWVTRWQYVVKCKCCKQFIEIKGVDE